MYHYINYLTDDDGNALAGATVNVYQPGTTTAVSIYSDDGTSGKANPFTTNSLGAVDFYAASQKVDINFSGTGIATPYTLEDIILFDPFAQTSGDTTAVVRKVTASVELKVPTSAPGTPAAGHVWEASDIVKFGANSKSLASLSANQTFTGQVSFVSGELKVPTAVPGTPAAGHVWIASDVLTYGANSKAVAALATAQSFTAAQTFSSTVNVLDGSLTIKNTASQTKILQLSAASITAGQTRTVTAPDFSGTLILDAGTQTLSGAKTFTAATAFSSTATITSNSASALAVGRQGATAPALKVDASTASSATGMEIVSAAAAGGVDLRAISSGTDENLTVNAKGAGTVSINPTGTGAITLARATSVTGALTGTSTSASALTIGANGATNPVLKVDASTGSVATGLSITGAATGGTTAVAVIDSGADANLSLNGKGTGTITLASTSTGNVIVPRTFVQGTDTTDRVAIKGMYMNPSNLAVTVPAITDPDIAKVDINVAAAFSMAPAVGDAVIAIPQEAMEAAARILGCYVTATDQITLVFGSEGGSVTGGAKNFKFMIFDLT